MTILLFLAPLVACGQAGAHAAARSAEERHVAGSVPVAQSPDADTTIAETTLHAIEAFRATVNGPLPVRLTGAAPSMDELIARFVVAVEAADTAALIALTMTRGEFIALHYPHSIYVRPPYELPPEDVWFLTRAGAEKGLTRLLGRFGGRPFGFVRYDCPSPARREGPNRWHLGCTITRTADGTEHTMRFFGAIWERDGAYKFGGYANDL